MFEWTEYLLVAIVMLPAFTAFALVTSGIVLGFLGLPALPEVAWRSIGLGAAATTFVLALVGLGLEFDPEKLGLQHVEFLRLARNLRRSSAPRSGWDRILFPDLDGGTRSDRDAVVDIGSSRIHAELGRDVSPARIRPARGPRFRQPHVVHLLLGGDARSDPALARTLGWDRSRARCRADLDDRGDFTRRSALRRLHPARSEPRAARWRDARPRRDAVGRRGVAPRCRDRPRGSAAALHRDDDRTRHAPASGAAAFLATRRACLGADGALRPARDRFRPDGGGRHPPLRASALPECGERDRAGTLDHRNRRARLRLVDRDGPERTEAPGRVHVGRLCRLRRLRESRRSTCKG